MAETPVMVHPLAVILPSGRVETRATRALSEELHQRVDVGKLGQRPGGSERRVPEGALARGPRPDVRIGLRDMGVAGGDAVVDLGERDSHVEVLGPEHGLLVGSKRAHRGVATCEPFEDHRGIPWVDHDRGRRR